MDTEKGYVIAVSDDSEYYLPNALHIERNDELNPWLFQNDEEAARGVEKDGVRLIYGMAGIDDGVYIDTPENRRVIENALRERNPDRENTNAHLPLRVYVENARNEQFGGFTMPLPTTEGDLRPFLEKIEIGGGQDIKIWEVLSDTEGLGEAVTEAMNKSVSPDTLNELNYLAAKIDAMHPQEYDAFAAALEAKRHCGSIAEIINLTENLDSFDIQPAFSEEQYGEFLLEHDGNNHGSAFEKLWSSGDDELTSLAFYIESLEKHVDKAAYGRTQAENENGVFTDRGYLTENGGFKEVYRGPEDIPAEYRVFSPTAQSQEKTADEAQRLVAPGIKSDEMLGRFLYDNKMLPEKDLQAANARLSFTAYPEDYYRMIGKKHREAGNGSFTQAGYAEGRQPVEKPVMEQLSGSGQQPELAAGTIPAPIRKVENTDLTTLLVKMHVLGGDYAADIHHNLNVLEARRSAEYLLLMNGRHAFLTEAAHVYRRGADSFDTFMKAEEENIDTRIFALHVTDVHKEHVVGDLAEMNVRELQRDLLNHSIRPVRIDATPKFGPEVSYTPEEWDKLEAIDRHMLQSWTRNFDPADSQAVIRHLEEAGDKHAQSGTAVSSDELLSEFLPLTPEHIIDEAAAAAGAGAAVVHLHARDSETGRPSSDPAVMKQIVDGVRKRCDVIVGITTGGAIGMTIEERLASVPVCKAELASCNAGSVNFCFSPIADKIVKPKYDWEIPFVKSTYSVPFANTFKDIEDYVRVMNENGVKPEFEVYEVGMLSNISFFVNRGIIKPPVYLQFVLGVMGGLPATVGHL